MFPPQAFNPKLIKKEKISNDTHSFYFERPQNFDFEAGQYIKMTLDTLNPDARGTSRFFTIASSPTEKEHLLITTRIIQSSFKKTLYSFQVGKEVKMRGPHGTFVLNEKDTRGKVYLAGGIGITPARSMLVYMRDKNLNIPMTLIASFSERSELIFYDELNSLANKVRKVVYIVTSEEGRIDEDKIRENVQELNSLFYISGPAGFVEAMEKLVKSLGVSEENIKSEEFPGY